MSNLYSIEDINQAIYEADLKIRPKIVFINPSDAEFVKSVLPNIEEEIVLQPTPFVEEGKMYVMERKDLEAWTFGQGGR